MSPALPLCATQRGQHGGPGSLLLAAPGTRWMWLPAGNDLDSPVLTCLLRCEATPPSLAPVGGIKAECLPWAFPGARWSWTGSQLLPQSPLPGSAPGPSHQPHLLILPRPRGQGGPGQPWTASRASGSRTQNWTQIPLCQMKIKSQSTAVRRNKENMTPNSRIFIHLLFLLKSLLYTRKKFAISYILGWKKTFKRRHHHRK